MTIFRSRQKTLHITRQIIIVNNLLKQVDNTKFVGVYIDKHLTWKTHVNFIADGISKYVGLLYKAQYYLFSKSLLTLYYAHIYPYLNEMMMMMMMMMMNHQISYDKFCYWYKNALYSFLYQRCLLPLIIKTPN